MCVVYVGVFQPGEKKKKRNEKNNEMSLEKLV